MNVPMLRMSDGNQIPQVGFGVFQVSTDEIEKSVAVALQSGYRSIDTAAAYGNEKGVGRAVADSGIDRDELFLTTKLWNSDQGYDATLRAFDTSMTKLGLDVLDLYLIHWPLPSRDLYVQTWRALVQLHADGRVRSIGTSNFQPTHLRRIAAETGVWPVLNQVELHPNLTQDALRAVHAEHGILTEAWSPLAQGGELLSHPVLTSIAGTYGVSPAQVVLRWHVQLGNVVIPKSVTPERIASNIDLFGFELSTGDMAQISGLDTGTRVGPDPDTFDPA